MAVRSGVGRRDLGRRNVLGLDIRSKLVARARKWAETLGAGNVSFMLANATVSVDSLLEGYPGPLDLVCIQFPDPHFKASPPSASWLARGPPLPLEPCRDVSDNFPLFAVLRRCGTESGGWCSRRW